MPDRQNLQVTAVPLLLLLLVAGPGSARNPPVLQDEAAQPGRRGLQGRAGTVAEI